MISGPVQELTETRVSCTKMIYIGRSTIDLKDTEMLYGSCFESLWSGLFDRKVSGLK